MVLNRENSLALLHEYTKSESLIKHAFSVEAAMLWYADYYKQSEEEKLKWGICGLLHDFDYEVAPHPEPPDGHPYFGNKILTELDYPEDIRTAVMGHALYTNTPRESLMAKVLFAVDELSGFITACTLVRPDRSLSELKLKSVKKKLKSKSFAEGCSREDISLGAEELRVDFDQHVLNVIEGLKPVADKIGLSV